MAVVAAFPHRIRADHPTPSTRVPAGLASPPCETQRALAARTAVNFLTGLYMNSKTPTWVHPWSEPGKNTKRIGVARNSFHAFAALAGVASVVFFFCGIFAVRDAVEHIPPATHTQAPSAKPSP
jgi:hypothetical protein